MRLAQRLVPIRVCTTGIVTAIILIFTAVPLLAQEFLSGIEWQEPPHVTPAESIGGAPSDAIILFDGKDRSQWDGSESWRVEDGTLVTGRGSLVSKAEFGDCQLHIEWTAPTPAKGKGQGRGNSGVFLMGRYELQVLDSFDNDTYYDGQAGAIYKQSPPLVNATVAPGSWNVYDIAWKAPQFSEDQSVLEPAVITVLHNGVVIQNAFQVLGNTNYDRPPSYEPHGARGPIRLQDHGNPVRFRNIWIRELKPLDRKQARPPFIRDGDKETPIELHSGTTSETATEATVNSPTETPQ